MKRALVLQGGTMRGAYLVGAMKKIYELLGLNYFDTILATSVGVFEQAFFAADQPDIMENTWLKYVHGRQLINIFNPLKGKAILDLDYLVDLFQSDKSLLNLQALKNSKPNLLTFIADYKTREPKIVNLKEAPVFDLMRATCALPIIYPRKVLIDGKRYVDCWMAPKDKLRAVLHENLKDYNEVLAITAYKKPDLLADIQNVIKPTRSFLWGAFDTSQSRIIKTIKQGEIDTEKFIKTHPNFSATINPLVIVK